MHYIQDEDDSPGSEHEPPEDDYGELAALDAHMAQRTPGSSMNKETWTSLDKNTQKVWDTITPADKAKILNYAKTRVQMEANMTDTQSESPPDIDEDTSPPTNSEDTDESSNDKDLEANASKLTETQSKTFPGDIRRMMSKKASKTPDARKKKMSSNTVAWSLNKNTRHEYPSGGRGDMHGIPPSDSLPPFHSSDSDPPPFNPVGYLQPNSSHAAPSLPTDPFDLQSIWNEDRTDFW